MSWFADLLRDPSVKNVDVDGGDRLRVHSRMLAKKPILKKVFTEFHHTFDRLDKKFLSGTGARIEIGAGVHQRSEAAIVSYLGVGAVFQQ